VPPPSKKHQKVSKYLRGYNPLSTFIQLQFCALMPV
jgi:hypothetical protein